MFKKNLYLTIGLFMSLAFFSCGFGKKHADVSSENVNLKEIEDSIDKADSLEIEKSMNEIDERGYIVKVGDTAPDFEIKLISGNSIRLSALRGKVVLLQFTASWCSVCRKEMSFIESDIWNKYRNNEKFVLIGIDREEDSPTIHRFIKETGVTYPIGLDLNGDIFALYADRNAGITRNVIINPFGEIVMLTRLYDENEFRSMCQKLNDMLCK